MKMFEDDVRILHKFVEKFKELQKRDYPDITEENDNGEWEIGCEFWNEMNSAYLEIIEKYEAESIGKELAEDMLYVIARDSECSHLLVRTLNYPKWFEVLCRYSITTDYHNAKWQFAEQLGSYMGDSDIKELLFYFIESGDEYTERMALYALHKVNSPLLKEYIAKSYETEYAWLKGRADKYLNEKEQGSV